MPKDISRSFTSFSLFKFPAIDLSAASISAKALVFARLSWLRLSVSCAMFVSFAASFERTSSSFVRLAVVLFD